MLFTCLQKYSVESTAQLDSIMVCFEVALLTKYDILLSFVCRHTLTKLSPEIITNICRTLHEYIKRTILAYTLISFPWTLRKRWLKTYLSEKAFPEQSLSRAFDVKMLNSNMHMDPIWLSAFGSCALCRSVPRRRAVNSSTLAHPPQNTVDAKDQKPNS